MEPMQSPAESPVFRIQLNARTLWPFLGIGLFWLILGWVLCWKLSPGEAQFRSAAFWFTAFWILSMLDLVALAKFLEHILGLMGSSQNRIFSVIRASYWGTLKLACIVLFGTLLWKGGASRTGIPDLGLLAGISTLVVVPLLGGLIWHFLSPAGEIDESSGQADAKSPDA